MIQVVVILGDDLGAAMGKLSVGLCRGDAGTQFRDRTSFSSNLGYAAAAKIGGAVGAWRNPRHRKAQAV
jgi:hypothetical protein